jgi:hypothetical protein
MSKILPAFIIFFSQTTQRGEGRRSRRRAFTCEGARRRLWSPTRCESGIQEQAQKSGLSVSTFLRILMEKWLEIEYRDLKYV